MDYGMELPQLVLAVDVDDPLKLKFKERKWLRIAHQTAGHACHQHYMTATILDVQPQMWEFVKQLNTTWLGTDCGVFGVTMNELEGYRALLRSYGLDCNLSYQDFEEAIYPIDCNFIGGISDDILPADLDDLIEWRSDTDKVIGMIHRWKLYILGENCD
jgi:hypothetical protein